MHTHIGEDSRVSKPTVDSAQTIISFVKEKGLDGIAITEHYTKDYGRHIRDIVEREFNGEILIIAGWEVERRAIEYVELDLPGGGNFRFVVHPGCPYHPSIYIAEDLEGMHGIEIHNHLHEYQIKKELVQVAVEEYGLITLQNSDAHRLEDIGRFFNEIDLVDLRQQAGL
ncbi:MAG: PHP domain-containing protein [Chloroflexota bacterium]|nr:PHP domain-containing protein [Chloroflexota bacterium]